MRRICADGTIFKKIFPVDKDGILLYTSTGMYNNIVKRLSADPRATGIALRAFAGISAAIALLLTFTISDYYIFNRMSEYGIIFSLCQWLKKAGVMMVVLAAFFNVRSCADGVKYLLPLPLILSCFMYGDFFSITKIADTPAQEIYNSVNLFFPQWLNMTLFFAQNLTLGLSCGLIFIRDGAKADGRAAVAAGFSVLATMPLNIFENFFDIDEIAADSFLRFKNFTIWHLIAILALAGVTIGLYYFLRGKSEQSQHKYLAAIAVSLLIQYHSKDSVVLGDGYNVYTTIFACIPLFICNIGVYVASLSVMLKKRVLYAISFFIHAAGALTVFVYFGKDEMSNYGIFCSYSILFFCFTHCFLFALCVLPSALGHYKFTIRQCVTPLIYYFIVIITASVASALVTSASMEWHTADGVYLTPDEWLMPNYAFTQINPLPFEVPPVLVLKIWNYELNVLYILGLYAVYVGLFFLFYGLYRAFLKVRPAVLGAVARRRKTEPGAAISLGATGELAAADDLTDEEEKPTENAAKESHFDEVGQ